jgi:transposase
VFIDETAVNTKMTRLYGRASRGERVKGPALFGHWKTMTFVAALRLDGITAPWLLDGAIDGDAFRTYVEGILVPALRPGDNVVLDNLPAHKITALREALARAAAQVFYLPPYSPDMNPIELAFARLKALLRQDPARSIAALSQRRSPARRLHPGVRQLLSPRRLSFATPAINTQCETALVLSAYGEGTTPVEAVRVHGTPNATDLSHAGSVAEETSSARGCGRGHGKVLAQAHLQSYGTIRVIYMSPELA